MGPQEAKVMHDSIANSQDDVQVLKGIQPKHQACYKFYRFSRFLAIFTAIIDAALFAFTFIPTFSVFTRFKFYRYTILLLLAFIMLLLVLMFLDKSIFLRKAPFDEWVYEIAEKC